jgi:hypothetical protein
MNNNAGHSQGHDINLDFHEFIATKKRKCDSTYVISSKKADIVEGSTVLSINSILTSTLTPRQLSCIFSGRTLITDVVLKVSGSKFILENFCDGGICMSTNLM